MSKPNRKRLNLETLRAQRLEASGSKYVELEIDDERVIKFLLRSWWPMDQVKRAAAFQKSAEDGDLEPMITVLRDACDDEDLFDDFRKQMTYGDFEDIFKEVLEDGLSEGESSSSSN
ncbi:hypothetical protein PO587_02845 [Streptomyces gilvifuscus]|uniref:Tail assembly chaperone n=1 Tax=Streptomyces gilvifuscus TaxID=1550617 RepID=A0ABT5FLJ6_9ACTN|nr:hypothetical protein [Streptomyces gilvifuscus]MDC2953389.1 hypothetical protein [Streptomyces gilvifuscus]